MSINCPVCRWLHEWGDNFNSSFVRGNVWRGEKGERKKPLRALLLVLSSWLCLWNKIRVLSFFFFLPLWYNLVGVGEVALDVLHLERVSIADLVVSPAVVGRLDHNDITPRAAEINCISFTWELPPDQPERQGRSAEPWQRVRRTETEKKHIKSGEKKNELKGSLLLIQ